MSTALDFIMKKHANVESVQADYGTREPKSKLPIALLLVTIALVVSSVILFFALKKKTNDTKESTTTSSSSTIEPSAESETSSTTAGTPTPEPTPEPTPVPAPNENQNPVLFPATAELNVPIGTPDAAYSPSGRGTTQVVYQGGNEVSGYHRADEIHMGDPLDYQQIPGILTFRGTNFRNCASWGTISLDPVKEQHFEQIWDYNGLENKKSSAWSFWWCGTGWTGQPLAVKWPYDLRQKMNLRPEKQAKEELTEVIIAAMDGYVYFFDLEDGQKTRDPLKIGATIKGTPAIDPRGYPLLYVGQGDDNGEKGNIGFRIFSLIDCSMLYMQNGLDSRAYRTTWGACDSSPLICADADTLIYPNENGMIYTVKLNTNFDPAAGTISINPDSVDYKYIFDGIKGSQLGIESSIAVYDHYGWCTDNAGNLICIDLNSLEMIWSRRLDDDSDVTPVIEEVDGHVYLYTGTEVDWQKDIADVYKGESFTYKFDAMTGEVVWRSSAPCYTKNAANSGDDVNGGMLGTPVVGKGEISDLVIFSYCMTKGVYSGNQLVAFDKATGEQVWAYDMNCYSWSSPVDVYDEQGNAYIVMCDSGGQIHLVDARTGNRVCYFQLASTNESNRSASQNIESSPIVVDGILVIGNRGNTVFGVKIS